MGTHTEIRQILQDELLAVPIQHRRQIPGRPLEETFGAATVTALINSMNLAWARGACEAHQGAPKFVNIFKIHERLTARLFPAYSNTDERFLGLALCGEVGELANMLKKRWRDGVDLTEEIKDELADIRVYLELLAKCFGIEGEKLDERVVQKLVKVAEKHKDRLKES